ncbi:MAG: alkaline phosphatase [Candidatus Aenigmarchaeota archaeon ex4484_224]|nr:MAG: alkaline phosphatase [Candidatus Aenigmarchaeota archaeon ex4484_224]
MIEDFFNFLIEITKNYGYLAIFIAMSGESALLPIPSEIVMPFSGYLAYLGYLNFWLIVLVASFANLFGSLISYFLGIKIGRSFIEKYGKYLMIRKKHLENAEKWFNRYGEITIFFGRVLPIVRTYISFPAGIAKMNLKKFLIYTFFGSIIWNFILSYFGFKLGENWIVIESFFEKIDFIVGIGIIFLFLLIFKKRVVKKKRKIPEEFKKE